MYKSTETYNSNTTSTIASRPRRGAYDALVHLPTEIQNLVEQVKQSAGWETGVTSEGMRSGGYESRNIDVYGYDVTRNLSVIQIRRAWKKKASWFTQVSKVYALVGIDEGQIFSHPLASSPRRNPHLAEMSPEAVVEWAESKIFGVAVNKLHTIIRQGDIAMIPTRGIPKDAIPLDKEKYLHDGVYRCHLRSSHHVIIDGVASTLDGVLYAEGAIEITHAKDEHKPVSATGKFKIVLGEIGDSPWWLDAEMGD